MKNKYKISAMLGQVQYDKYTFFDDMYSDQTLQSMKDPKLTQLTIYYYLNPNNQTQSRIVGIKYIIDSRNGTLEIQPHKGNFNGNVQEYCISLQAKIVGDQWYEECIDRINGHFYQGKLIGLDFKVTAVPNVYHVGGMAGIQDQKVILDQQEYSNDKYRIVGFGGTAGEFLETLYVVQRQSTGLSKSLPKIQSSNQTKLLDILKATLLAQPPVHPYYIKPPQQLSKGQVIQTIIGKFNQGQHIFDIPNGTNIADFNMKYTIKKLLFSVTRGLQELNHIYSLQVIYQFQNGNFCLSEPISTNVPNSPYNYMTQVEIDPSEVIQGVIGQFDNAGIIFLRFILYDQDIEDNRCVDIGSYNPQKEFTLIGDQTTKICGIGGTYSNFIDSLYFIKE